MKARANFVVGVAAGLCGLPALAAFAADGAEAPPAYQDRVIGGGTLAPDISLGDGESSAAQGLAHSLQIDGVVSALHSGSSGSAANVMENGFVLRSQWETVSYGAWSLDASGRTGGSGLGPSEQGQGGVLTLRQRAMPFDGGWLADNALGDVNTPEVALARLQPRFYLPTGAVQGLSTEWRGPSGLQVVAGGGRPGVYDGIEVPDLRTLPGEIASLGAQWAPSEHWTVGGQLIGARDANLAVGPVIDGGTLQSSGTGLASAAWADRGARVQVNLVDGQVSGKGNAVGSWIDGTIVSGHWQQNAGLFRIDPNLTWGSQLISNDMQGGYYRLGYQDRRLLADVGIDEVRSVSGSGSNTTFATGDTRYQLSRDWGVGGVTNVSLTDGGTGWSLEGYVDRANGWGTGRAEANVAETPLGRDGALTLDQTWATSGSLRLSTSASVERINKSFLDGARQDSTVLGMAAFGGGQFTNRLGIEGNVRWAGAVQGRAAPGVSANVSMTYQVAQSWQVLATYYDSRSGSWTPITVISPLTPPIATLVPALQERGAFLTVRYHRASGLHFAPLGGPPGGGSGELAGIVYLDANDNGQCDAGELGAPNVTVVLDGRFSVQTDVRGRFQFPAVATGHHVIAVISDNLPLPWTLAGDGRLEVVVTTRDRTDLAIAARRER
ncbi:MAG TPA: hypothetical protein VKP66_21735 [Steroidobacteraceae bacterium]|nr:hypothetical protein [Steroidobacteraceae bacterium]